MKLPAPAPLVRKRLAAACTAALAIALLACAPALSTGKHQPPWSQLAMAEEATQTLPPGISVAPTFQHPEAPTVTIVTSPSELSFLLTDDERAHISSGGSVQLQLTSTPMVDPSLILPSSKGPQGAASDSNSSISATSLRSVGSAGGISVAPSGAETTGGAESNSETTAQPIGQNGQINSAGGISQSRPSGKPSPPPIPAPLLIDSAALAPITAAAEQVHHLSSSSVKSGYTPFDIALSITIPGSPASTRQVTGPFPGGKTVKLNVTLTDAIVTGTRGMGESFDFLVWHGVFDASGALEATSTRGTQDNRTVSIVVSSFSPFILGWGDMKAASGTGGVTTPSTGGSGGGSGSGGTPSTPPSSPEPVVPAPPAADDPAPEAAAPATPARPFLAWSPTQTRRSISLRWTPAEGADGYLVYGCRCNHGGVKRKPALITELGPSATSWTERRLPVGEWHKYVVRAFRDDGDRRMILARSPQVHAATLGGKSRTARGAQITSVHGDDGRPLALREPDPTSNGLQILEVSADQRVTIAARELGRKLTVHHRPMRFALWSASAGSAPITSKDGAFTLQQPGIYLLWAYAQSGTHHMIEVRVQE